MSTSMDQGHISIVIVTADSGASASACVQRALASDVPVDVTVVDNGSADGVPEAIARANAGNDRVRVRYNRANLGFGRAVNRGAREAGGEFLLVLNPDCMLKPDTARKLRDAVRQDPQAGLAGAVIENAQGTVDPASRRRDPLLHRVLTSMRGEAGKASDEGVNVPGPMPSGISTEEAVSGALMLLPMAVFRRCEGFDTDYFLHFEDLDLCRRVRDLGYQVLLVGNAHVVHAGGGSSRHRPVFVSRHKHASMWRWFRKFDPASKRVFTAALVWLGIWTHFLLTLPRILRTR